MGFKDPLPQPRRQDLAPCYLGSFSSPPPAGPSLEVSLQFVDAEGGAPLRDELDVTVCPFQAPGMPSDCSEATSTASTSGGALTLAWPLPPPMPPQMMPPPGGPPGEMPSPPYVRVASGTYFPTIVMRQPAPSEGTFWPALPVFSREALEQTFEPEGFGAYLSERAHLAVVTYDSNGRPASNIEVLLDGNAGDGFTVPFIRGETGLPVYDQMVSGDDGFVGFLNVPTIEGRAAAPLIFRDTRYNTVLTFRGSQRPVPLRKGHLTLLIIALLDCAVRGSWRPPKPPRRGGRGRGLPSALRRPAPEGKA